MSAPSVLFVCVKNGGKSQMAAGLMRQAAGDAVTVDSAGTAPGSSVNALSAEVLAEVGVDITDQVPKAITDDLVRSETREREQTKPDRPVGNLLQPLRADRQRVDDRVKARGLHLAPFLRCPRRTAWRRRAAFDPRVTHNASPTMRSTSSA